MRLSTAGETTLHDLRPAWAWIDLDRLRANYLAVQQYASVPLMPVVKANAYGHGALPVAQTLLDAGADRLAVAYVEEALVLRQGGINAPIVVLAGFTAGQAGLLASEGLVPVVATPDQAHNLLGLARHGQAPLAVHLKVDTGMGRLGFDPAEVLAVARELAASGLCVIEGFMTHLAVADEDRAFTEHQLDLFDRALLGLQEAGIRPRWVHAAASAGLAFLRPSHTLARPGLLLYGLQPRPLSPPVGVRPVMRVSARIAFVKDVPAGASISYGRRWRAERYARIATLPIGYADGVPRTDSMATRGYLTIGTRQAPVRGTVCMDLLMIDVTPWSDVSAGDEATLFGDDPLAWDVAEWAGTNAWQVLTAVGPRLPRVYRRDGKVLGFSPPLP